MLAINVRRSAYWGSSNPWVAPAARHQARLHGPTNDAPLLQEWGIVVRKARTEGSSQ